MARFRGTVKGCRGAVSRLGHASSGLKVTANGWSCGIRVEVSADGGDDVFRVFVTGGSGAVVRPEFEVVKVVSGVDAALGGWFSEGQIKTAKEQVKEAINDFLKKGL